jgi:hypothetical protein
MEETLERDVRVARTNVERDIARLADAVDQHATNKALALTGAAAAVGLLLGFGGMKVIKIALLLGAVGGATAIVARKYVGG